MEKIIIFLFLCITIYSQNLDTLRINGDPKDKTTWKLFEIYACMGLVHDTVNYKYKDTLIQKYFGLSSECNFWLTVNTLDRKDYPDKRFPVADSIWEEVGDKWVAITKPHPNKQRTYTVIYIRWENIDEDIKSNLINCNSPNKLRMETKK